jgi:hypothetical protein
MVMLILACLLSDPSSCKTFQMPLSEDITMMQCARFSQTIMADWQKYHPERHIERGRCVPADRVEHDL